MKTKHLKILVSCICLMPLTGMGLVNFEFRSDPTYVGGGSSTSEITAGAVYRYAVTNADNNTHAYDMIVEFDAVSAGSFNDTPSYDSSTSYSAIIGGFGKDASKNPYATFKLSFINKGANDTQVLNESYTLATIANLNIQAFDIDSHPDLDFTDMFGYKDDLKPFVGLHSDTDLELDTGFLSGYNMYGEKPAAANDWTNNDNISYDSFEQKYHTVNLEFDTFSEGYFAMGLKGTSNQASNRHYLINMSNPPFIEVPEPSTYAAIFGGVVLALAMYRRRKQ